MCLRVLSTRMSCLCVSRSASVWVAGDLVYFSASCLPVRIRDVWSVSVSVSVWVVGGFVYVSVSILAAGGSAYVSGTVCLVCVRFKVNICLGSRWLGICLSISCVSPDWVCLCVFVSHLCEFICGFLFVSPLFGFVFVSHLFGFVWVSHLAGFVCLCVLPVWVSLCVYLCVSPVWVCLCGCLTCLGLSVCLYVSPVWVCLGVSWSVSHEGRQGLSDAILLPRRLILFACLCFFFLALVICSPGLLLVC